MKMHLRLIFLSALVFILGLSSCSKDRMVPEYLLGNWVILEDESIAASKIETISSSIDWDKRRNYIKDKKLKISSGEIQTNHDKPEIINLVSAHNSIYVFENSNYGTIIAIKYIDKDLIRVDWSVATVEYYKRVSE